MYFKRFKLLYDFILINLIIHLIYLDFSNDNNHLEYFVCN